MEKDSVVKIERLASFNPEDAIGIGKLSTSLSEHFDGNPIDQELLQEIIASPYHVQIVARDENGKIIGVATVSTVYSPMTGRIAYLEDIVVDKNTQGNGTGKKLWDEVVSWSHEHNLNRIEFTSNPSRKTAHAFYKKLGANSRSSTPFRFEL